MNRDDALTKEFYDHRMDREMAQHFSDNTWIVTEKMALACRMLAMEGHGSGLAGQISVRGPQLGTFHMLQFGLGFDEATANSILLVDEDLQVLEGNGMPNPANRFHLWIYKVRPDINCIVHTHPPYISALSMVGEELAVAHMDATYFYNDCGFLKHWPGVPIGNEEGELIAGALGNKRTALLAHHGQLSTGKTVEEAAVLAIFIERAAKLQIFARTLGPIQPLNPTLAQEAHDWWLKPKSIGATFNYFARRVLKTQAECLA